MKLEVEKSPSLVINYQVLEKIIENDESQPQRSEDWSMVGDVMFGIFPFSRSFINSV